MPKLTKKDFFDKYGDSNFTLSFASDNLTISNVKNWDYHKEIQRYTLSSDNCYFITLEFDEMVIRID